MLEAIFKRGCVFAVSLSLIGVGLPMTGHARIVDTQTVVQAATRDANLATVRASLNRADVRDRMVALGVNAATVEARLSGLTDVELDKLARQADQMPAGGSLLAAIGFVFVVLLILELVGVIDIFKKR